MISPLGGGYTPDIVALPSVTVYKKLPLTAAAAFCERTGVTLDKTNRNKTANKN
jgi:hypothetical protein